jgi:hypothetical protein
MADTMTLDAAKCLVQAVEDAFGAADLTAIEQGFTVSGALKPFFKGRPGSA